MNIKQPLKIDTLIKSKNIAELLAEEDLVTIAQRVIHDYDIDLESRADWETRNADSLKLALQLTTQKSIPWPNCANVMYPLITMAAMQCHAREYPALIVGSEPVKCRVVGRDERGLKTLRAGRVSAHMSYQLLEEDTNWEEEMDRVLFTKGIIGSAFKKVYYDPALQHNVAEGVLAQDLVIPYKAKSLEKASRITQKIELSRNTIYERVARGIYLDLQTEQGQQTRDTTTEQQQVSDTLQGQTPASGDFDTPLLVLEQHRYLDLDGDGYEEPYIVTVEKESKKIRRIVARYFKDSITTRKVLGEVKILYIKPQHFYVKYGMLPSPDGGIYDIGFGALLGSINHTVNTVINQLLDQGTLATLGGGFLGRGAKLRRGQAQFLPGEWKQVDGSGNDLKNSVVPLPINPPSQVLFSLLGLLINAGERVVGTTEIMTGDNIGQNTPAQTAQEMVKQGSVVFGGIFKRTYRSLKKEFQLWYRLNQIYIEDNQSFTDLTTGNDAMVMPEDYQGSENEVKPSADPNISSVEKRVQQAMFLKQMSASGPGYIPLAIEKRLLEAAQIPYLSEVWDGQSPPPANPKVQAEQARLEFDMMKLKADMQYKQLALMLEAQKVSAEIQELQARAAQEMANAEGMQAGHMIALLNAEIGAKKHQQDGLLQTIKVIKELVDSTQVAQQGGKDGGVQVSTDQGGMGAMAAQPGNQGGFALP